MFSSCSHATVYRSTPLCLAILGFTTLFGVVHTARAQVSAAPLNQTLAQGQGAGNNYFLIASTPPDNDSDGDHMHLVMTFNCNAYSNCNSTLDATFGNRGGFVGTYSARGASPTGLDVHLVAYRQPDTSTNIYIYLGNYYVSATYSVLENAGDTIYTNPTASAAAPTGTLVFDSSTISPPSFYSNFAGQLSSAAGIVFPDTSVQTTAYIPGTITNANGVITIQNPAGTAGIQIATNSQAVGGLFGEGGNLILQADSVSDTAFTGGTIFLGGSHRGDAERSQTYLYGESAIGGNSPTGILIDGQDRGSGIQNNVGIGLPTGGVPAAKLEVNGNMQVDGTITSNGSTVCTATNLLCGSSGTSTATPILTQNSGNIQINGGLNTTGGIVAVGQVLSEGPGAGFRVLSGTNDNVNGAPWYGVGASNLNLFTGSTQNSVQVAGYFGLDFETATGTMVMRGDSGYIGLETDSPEERLEVNGNIKLTANTQYMMFGDGTKQSTAWNGILPSQDYAESIDVQGSRADYEPGDLIVIDPEVPGKFSRSSAPYSRLIAGVFSTKPGLLGMKSIADVPNQNAEVPMAMMGIVPTKVSTENGPISPGDLLVSSGTPGYAMKGTDTSRLVGAVVGKALAPLRDGFGTVPALISLQ